MNVFPDEIINQLWVCLGSIKAGNSSIRLQHQFISLLDSLVENGVISEKHGELVFLSARLAKTLTEL